jgi:hypothetical protein
MGHMILWGKVSVDPSLRGNELREFQSEKCVNFPKGRSLELLKCRRINLIRPNLRDVWHQVKIFRGFGGSRFGSFEMSHEQISRNTKL